MTKLSTTPSSNFVRSVLSFDSFLHEHPLAGLAVRGNFSLASVNAVFTWCDEMQLYGPSVKNSWYNLPG